MWQWSHVMMSGKEARQQQSFTVSWHAGERRGGVSHLQWVGTGRVEGQSVDGGERRGGMR